MAKLSWIDLQGPVLIDPFRTNHDRSITEPVEGQPSVELVGDAAHKFYEWVQRFWLDKFESDLQPLATHAEHGDLLTTGLPLASFIEDLCSRGERAQDQSTDKLLEMLSDRARAWQAAGADMVYISGRDSFFRE
ncbi:hypothetical protein [Pseudomonas savastanoi]|uniref:hypothetical protein n=1 Tax=Pseudomonas savastanoi TaxID=29438 RepID=UPI0017821D62|nr:hypothetical protein [Pseudomonas savastanoi]QOI07935.1 hypothetical protein D5S10_29875 [Pseudomonas savastanoi]